MLTKRFDQALQLASDLHRTQTRKATTIPYVSHLMAVTALVLEYGGNEDQAIAALLHDSAEDQGGREILSKIEAQFGRNVATMVEELSDSLDDTANGQPKAPWLDRKKAYLETLPDHGTEVLLVSACDKLHNSSTILRELNSGRTNIWERFKGGRDGSLWYYGELLEVFRKTGLPADLVAEFGRVVAEMKRLAR